MENKRPRSSFFSQKNSSTDRRESTGSSSEGRQSRGAEGGVPRESRERKPFMGKREDEPRRQFSPRPDGERKPYGERRTDDRKPYGERSASGERKPYGERSADGERKSYGERRTDDRKPYGDKRFEARGDQKRTFGGRTDDRSGRPERNDRTGREQRSDRPDRTYLPNERKPRHLRESNKPKERDPFSRQVFVGNSDSYSERLDSTRKPKKPTIKPRGASPVKVINHNEPVRLNRFIAQSGVCSRREADELIKSGEVTVNGIVVTELGTKVERNDKIEFQGKQLRGEKKVYIIMNKPKGFITSVDDPHNDRTVMDLLKGEVPQRVYPVGRLDKYTTGVLLLTNDGDLTKELTHPSYEKSKIYHVFLDKNITEADLNTLLEGVTLEDGDMKADEISTVGSSRKEVGIELHSGKNRIVRRMFEHLGYEIERLDRVYFAGMTKVGLRRGFWRYMTESEVAMLKSNNYR